MGMGNTAAAAALKAQWYWLFPQASSTAVSAMPARDLELGMTGGDVLALQKLLNANGFALAASGIGASGQETDYFGSLTKAALAKYQAAHGIAPTAGYFGSITRAQMKTAGAAGAWW
jgi:peptidoglycan hydrolase-like protein with peptidoglycan-binding domain